MSAKILPRATEALAIVMIAMVGFTVTPMVFQGALLRIEPETSGEIVPMALAEYTTVEKEVGDIVVINVKVKNTGNVVATYVVRVWWCEDGTDDWEPCGIEDKTLLPGAHDIFEVGEVECTEEMMGKYFDVKIVLYEAGTENALDDDVLDKAWYVNEVIILGTIVEFWIE